MSEPKKQPRSFGEDVPDEGIVIEPAPKKKPAKKKPAKKPGENQ